MMLFTRQRLAVLPVILAVGFWSAPVDAADVDGTNSSDIIFGTRQRDAIRGLDGGDIIFGKSGNDTILGGGGTDYILLGAGKDTVDAGESTGTDVVFDDDGRTTTTEKPDRIFGGADNDSILSADGEKDSIDCGDGQDAAVADRNDVVTGCESVIVGGGFVGAGGPGLYFEGTRGRDTFTGTTVGDILAGKNGNDLLSGGDGPDLILGGLGRDNLHGDAGSDSLHDDDGAPGDRLFGGPGGDVFMSADGAVTEIDCGLNDGESDAAYADQDDILFNCTPGDAFIFESDV
jgi:Ca2+-binding RTX toxin-like protein